MGEFPRMSNRKYNLSESSKEKRQESTDTNGSFAYTIPKDLADAARVLAEYVPPTASTGEEEALAAKVHAKKRYQPTSPAASASKWTIWLCFGRTDCDSIV